MSNTLPTAADLLQTKTDAIAEVRGTATVAGVPTPTNAQLLARLTAAEAVIASIPALIQSGIDTYNTGIVAPLTTRVGAAETSISTNAQAILLKANASAVTTLQSTLTQHTADIAARLPLTGGTMTGPLNVMPPTAAANPLQFSTLPLSMQVDQALPLLALGTVYAFTVTVANAVVGQVVVLNPPVGLLASLSFYGAIVSAANTVTISLKAGVSIAAGTQTFYLRVLR